jgi:hypothetical protein
MPNKATATAFRPSIETKAALQRAAGDDRRSVSSLILKILDEWLMAHGYLVASEKPEPRKRSSRP